MVGALHVGVGPAFGCAALDSFAGDYEPSCSASVAPLQLKSIDVFSSKQTRLVTRLSPQMSTRRWNLRASSNDVRAAASGNIGDDPETSFASLVPETPTGKHLVSVLRSRPHMFTSSADEQLERLVADRDAADRSGEVTGSILYQRIKEVKDKERRKAVEEAIYALVAQKAVDAGVTLTPKIRADFDDSSRYVDISPAQDRELEALHSPEAFEMVREHLAVVALQMVSKHHLGLILGCQGTSRFLDQLTFAPINKLSVGQVYAASIMYGYFLRRVDQRFQLKKNLEEQMLHVDASFQDAAKAMAATIDFGNLEFADEPVGSTLGSKSSKLRAYVLSFDSEILQQFATIRTEESLNVIEKRAEALFGKPEMGGANDTIEVSLPGLRRLVLEAVAFGTFLWDVEIHVDSHYGLTSQ